MDQAAAAEAEAIGHKAHARIGLLGNPSDVYYGNTISPALRNFYASVKFEPSEPLLIRPHPFHDLVHFQLPRTSGSFLYLAPLLSVLILVELGSVVKFMLCF